MADIVVNRIVDEESSRLFFDCAQGTVWPRTNIRVVNGVEVLVIELADVYVTSYMLYGESGIEPPKESFSLHYNKITYTVYDSEHAAIDRGWDLLKNKPLF
jgi:type VI protein secretion system component Hcp